jgi:hypothetical protein
MSGTLDGWVVAGGSAGVSEGGGGGADASASDWGSEGGGGGSAASASDTTDEIYWNTAVVLRGCDETRGPEVGKVFVLFGCDNAIKIFEVRVDVGDTGLTIGAPGFLRPTAKEDAEAYDDFTITKKMEDAKVELAKLVLRKSQPSRGYAECTHEVGFSSPEFRKSCLTLASSLTVMRSMAVAKGPMPHKNAVAKGTIAPTNYIAVANSQDVSAVPLYWSESVTDPGDTVNPKWPVTESADPEAINYFKQGKPKNRGEKTKKVEEENKEEEMQSKKKKSVQKRMTQPTLFGFGTSSSGTSSKTPTS